MSPNTIPSAATDITANPAWLACGTAAGGASLGEVEVIAAASDPLPATSRHDLIRKPRSAKSEYPFRDHTFISDRSRGAHRGRRCLGHRGAWKSNPGA